MLNEDVRRQWVAALRSGEFEQGKGALTKISPEGAETHCCLGVLCVLAERAGKTPSREINREEWDAESARYRTGRARQYVSPDHPSSDQYTGVTYLPGSVAEWAGTGTLAPLVIYHGHPMSLAELNDVHDLTFDQIADLIESSPSVSLVPQLGGEDYAEWVNTHGDSFDE